MAEGKNVNLGNVLKEWAGVIVAELRAEIEKDKTKASGKLLASIAPRINISGSKFTLEILMEDYWKWVDEGRSGGKFPPIEAISKWIAQKGFPIRPEMKIQRTVQKRFGVKHRTTLSKSVKTRNKQLAFLIARSIAKKGTIKRFGYGGSNFVTDFAKSIEERMAASIEEKTGKEIEIQIIKDIK